MVVVYARLFVYDTTVVLQGSMLPTLEPRDLVIAVRRTERERTPDRGDVFVLSSPLDGDLLVKRIIGLGGEVLDLRNGAVYVDHKRLPEDYLPEPMIQDLPVRFTVPKGYVFVMGDNRNNSEDSRMFGPVSTDALRSKVVVRVWPLSRFGPIS